MSRHRDILVLLSLFATLYFPSPLSADGGTLRVSQRNGGFHLSIFTSPTPIRAGEVDISVFVQDAATGLPVQDVAVTVRAHPAGVPSQEVTQEATTAQATNKLFRAAVVELPQPGRWQVSVHIQVRTQSATVDFEVDVAEPHPAWWGMALWIGWPIVVVALFGVHQWLVRRRSRA
jgi:hypothetical protein